MSYETFRVVDVNEQFGFARLRLVGRETLFHSELYPEADGPSAQLQLKPGDSVRGLRRGEAVTQLAWLSRTPVPAEQVMAMVSLLTVLKRFGLETQETPEALAERQWRRARDEGPFEELLNAAFPKFFAWEHAHPFDDESLLSRFVSKTREQLSGFEVEPVQGKPLFRTQPGGTEVEAPASDRGEPGPTFAPLLGQANALLSQAGSPWRWLRVARNWVFAPPDVLASLVRIGFLEREIVN